MLNFLEYLKETKEKTEKVKESKPSTSRSEVRVNDGGVTPVAFVDTSSTAPSGV